MVSGVLFIAYKWSVSSNTKYKNEETNTYISYGMSLNQQGLNVKSQTGGNSDTIPIELPDDIVIDSNTKLVWSASVEQNIADWRELGTVAVLVAAFVFLCVDDGTLIGVGDDIVAYEIGSYLMNILSSWGNAINQLIGAIPAYASCGL